MASDFIQNLQRKRCDYNHPDQATSQANSLILLSSGIYTEEERFVFELLQNAVDAHNNSNSVLDVKIAIENDYLIFLHNGDAFTERDIEGLCDVGNGNKMKDVKKIGYKGIGFKSVFMRSNYVVVESGGYCFKFDKSYWENYWDGNWNQEEFGLKDEDKKYLMPWQIIPIETQPPIQIESNGYNVVTYIKINETHTLDAKISKLLSNSQFLLFLKSKNIRMEFVVNGLSKCWIGKSENNGEVVLSVDGIEESRWLMHVNDNVEVPVELKGLISADINTPDKLKDVKTFDLSFAIALDKNGKLRRLEKDESVIYTYLPTSYRFGSEGFPFLVNANFITDAGRQQLHKDSEWNKLIFSKIPSEFLIWIKDVSSSYKNYWEILPEKSYGRGNSLEIIYENNMDKAIKEIAFIPSLQNVNCKVLASEAFMDRLGISEAISANALVNHINRTYSSSFDIKNQISNIWKGSKILNSYGVFIFDKQKLKALFDDKNAFENISIELDVKLINFLFEYYLQYKTEQEELVSILQSTQFLLDENNTLCLPGELFFPSSYKAQNAFEDDAKILKQDIYNAINSNKQIINWLSSLGVEHLSDVTFIKKVICKSGYITKENAIEIGRFLFNVNKKINIFEEVGDCFLSDIRFLSKRGTLLDVSSLYLSSVYNPIDDLEKVYDGDIYISEEYSDTDYVEYGSFFRKFGISDSIKVKLLKFKRESDVYDVLKDYVSYATKHEYNYSSWTGGKYYMYFSYINIKYVPLINIVNTSHLLSKFVWTRVLANPIEFKREDDYIYGSTGGGYTKKAYLCDREEGHMYLGENFLPWVIKNHQTFPSTNGKLMYSKVLLVNSDYIKQVVGSYLPVIDIDSEIHESWNDLLQLKNTINLDDCLTILTNISNDTDHTEQNKERICKIYQRLIELDALSENNREKIKNWASSNFILSKDNKFVSPSELSYITLDGFSSKKHVYIGSPSNRDKVIELLALMGVNIITSESINTEFESKEESQELKNILKGKVSALALLASGENTDESLYNHNKSKLIDLIDNTNFYHCKSIKLTYGDSSDVIEKHTFGNKNEFYYIGNLRPANIEPLLTPLCKYLDIRDKERELFILFIEDFEGIRQNLKDKGYKTDLLEEDIIEDSGTIQTSYSRNRTESQYERDVITGFKGEIIVYEKLKSMGYDPVCLSISTKEDYTHLIEMNGVVYYCKPNYEKYDISFMTDNGVQMYVEVKSTTRNKYCQENIPISYRELTMIEDCNDSDEKSYVIVRVFGVDAPAQDIYVFKSHLL